MGPQTLEVAAESPNLRTDLQAVLASQDCSKDSRDEVHLALSAESRKWQAPENTSHALVPTPTHAHPAPPASSPVRWWNPSSFSAVHWESAAGQAHFQPPLQ